MSGHNRKSGDALMKTGSLKDQLSRALLSMPNAINEGDSARESALESEGGDVLAIPESE